MNKPVNNLQDIFLNNARKNKTQIILHLTNGFQIRGLVQGFDNYTVVIYNGEKQQLVYKHAISTITPETPLLFQ